MLPNQLKVFAQFLPIFTLNYGEGKRSSLLHVSYIASHSLTLHDISVRSRFKVGPSKNNPEWGYFLMLSRYPCSLPLLNGLEWMGIKAIQSKTMVRRESKHVTDWRRCACRARALVGSQCHLLKEVEPSRTFLIPWPQVLENFPVLGSRTTVFFESLKFCRSPEKNF